MKNIKKSLVLILILTMLFSMTSFASESIINNEPSIIAQTEDDGITRHLTCSSTAGDVSAVVGCIYSAYWEEGIAGQITSAYFSVDNIKVGNTTYTAGSSGSTYSSSSGSSIYRNYTAGPITVRIGVTCDAWGNVTLNMQQYQ